MSKLIILVIAFVSNSSNALRPYKSISRTSTSSENQLRYHYPPPCHEVLRRTQSALLLSVNDKDTDSRTDHILNAKSTINNDNTDDIDKQSSNLTPAYISLFLILLTFSSNQWSRQAIFYLCNFSANATPFLHMNAALNFDKEMYAFLASFGFTAVFALFSLIAGNVADKFNRKNIISISCAIWSASTFLQSKATSYDQLIPLRIILGMSQAFFNPAAYTLISDIFPKNLVGRMNGILSGGVYIGGGLASLSILLDDAIGWRDTVSVIGVVGIVVAIISNFLIVEPKAEEKSVNNTKMTVLTDYTSINDSSSTSSSGGNNVLSTQWQEVVSSISSSLREVLSNREACLLLIATGIRFCAGFTIGIWKAPFVFAKFPEEIAMFAGSNAAIVSIGGFLSSVIGGYLSDTISSSSSRSMPASNTTTTTTTSSIDVVTGKLSTSLQSSSLSPFFSSSRPKARVWVAAIGSLLAAPLFAKFILAETSLEASGWLLAEYLVAECWIGPTLAALFESVGKSKRGFAQGLFSLLIAFGNIAPVLVSYLTQSTTTTNTVVNANTGASIFNVITTEGYSLSDVLLVAVCGAYIVSGLLFGGAAIIKESQLKKEQQ